VGNTRELWSIVRSGLSATDLVFFIIIKNRFFLLSSISVFVSGQLSGSLPSEWAGMTSMIFLYYYYFFFSLSSLFPSNWSCLPFSNSAVLTTYVSGSLPSAWSNLSLLEYLYGLCFLVWLNLPYVFPKTQQSLWKPLDRNYPARVLQTPVSPSNVPPPYFFRVIVHNQSRAVD